MTFAEIVTDVSSRLNLTSAAATTRVGLTVNRVYKKVTTAIGLNVSRHTQVQADATLGVQTLTFTGIEKITSVIDKLSGADRFLDEQFLDELKRGVIGTGQPTKYAIYRMNAGTVEIYMDTVPQDAFTLYADGFERASTLSGSQEPAFPESFHDIIIEGALYEEYLKLEKTALAKEAKDNYEDRMGDLRIFIAKSPQQDIYVGKRASASLSGGSAGSGGSSVNGSLSYTQTGLITFDRDPSAPFAVTSGSAIVANLIIDPAIMTIASQAQGDVLYASSATAWARLAKNTTATRYLSNTGGSNNPAWAQITLTDGVTGILPVANGGSGIATLTANRIPYGNGTSAFQSDADLTFDGTTLTLNGPLVISGAAGGQISFPATQNASSGANVLDDYEEGAWTPAFGGTGGQSGQVYTTQIGRYIKVGKHVTCWGDIVLSTLGTLTTAVQIKDLPFTAGASVARGVLSVGYWAALTSTFVWLSGVVTASTVVCPLFCRATAGATLAAVVQGDLSATTELVFRIDYEAAN